MDLIWLYGPPGVGKLTVAKALSKLTGFGVFHSQLTIAPVRPILDWDDPLFFKIVNKMRLDLIEVAAKSACVGLIYTMVYADKKDDSFIRKIIKTIKKHKGRVCFVKLHCHHQVHQKRVVHPSRKSMEKIHTVKKLDFLCKKYDLHATIPFGSSLDIDNTHVSATSCAARIARRFKLRKKRS